MFATLVRVVSVNRCCLIRYSTRTINKINAPKLPHTSAKFYSDSKKDALVPYDSFESIKIKNKNTYLDMVKIYEGKGEHRRGHVEFIYAALKNMEAFHVQKDLQVYKAIIDVLPKGKFIPSNMYQAEFMHYPKQQQCIVDLLEQMEENGVMPDGEMEDMLLNIFGKRGFPLRKYWRMMYWMPKFKDLSPWPLPNPLPKDVIELAKLAIERIISVDVQSKLIIFDTKDVVDSNEQTWIVSGQSITQQRLLDEHDPEKAVYVEGPYRIWIRNQSVNYFMLRAEPKQFPEIEEDSDDVSHLGVPLSGFSPPTKKELGPIISVHEQEDGVIFAVCATGTSGRDSLLSWIRLLERNGNPVLGKLPIVFKFRAPEQSVVPVNQATDSLDDR